MSAAGQVRTSGVGGAGALAGPEWEKGAIQAN